MSSRILVFLIVSMLFVAGYAALNFLFLDRAEQAVLDAGGEAAAVNEQVRSAQCERAWQRYDSLFEDGPSDGNYERHANQLDMARQNIDRACPSN